MPGYDPQPRAARPAQLAPEQGDRHRTLLRESRLRVTGVRLAILRELEEAHEAMTAQQVFDRVAGPHTGKKSGKGKRGGSGGGGGAPDRVTVYRTLNSLVESGIAHRIDPGDRIFRFSLTDHARCTEHHHVHEHPHFVCDSCGKVECMDDAEVIIKTREMAAPPPGSAGTPRRNIRLQDVVLHGTCEKCAEAESGRRP